MRRTIVTVAALVVLVSPGVLHAWVHEGEVAPDFTKNTLAGPPWTTGPAVSLGGYAGKVVVLFLLGCT
ncbi:MAG TPA: hypothetical protein VGK89_02350 [Candidatus Eisenbacteria bacterium]|jgi:hypothetical protein